MNQLTHTSLFVEMRYKDERGKEYWSARELCKMLGYSSWQSFQNTIIKASEACRHNNQYELDHVYLEINMIRTGNGAWRKTEAYRLSRSACYLIILNADSHKPIIALGQAYFAYHARRQELIKMISLSSRPDHLIQEALRLLLYTYDCKLLKAAQETRLVEPEDFAIFFNHEYMGILE